MKELAGVTDAQVNFGASKITVYGEITIEQLERAGAFEGLTFRSDREPVEIKREPWWKNKHALQTIVSGLLLIVAFFFEEGSLPAITFYLTAIAVGGYTLFIKGLKNVSKLRFDMNTLMTIAILGAAAIGEWKEGAVVVFLFAISEMLESYSMNKARQSIHSLLTVAPKEALIRKDGIEASVPVDDIEIGDLMIVKPGEKIAMDGVVTIGHSTVNQAAITGESIPIQKLPGDEVFAGTLNEDGLLEVTVTKLAEDTTIAKIIHLVEEAQGQKAPSQRFVDRFATYYTPVILLLAFGLAVIPPLFLGGAWSDWIYRGLAVLVVGCPCALVVSTPVAIVTAIGNAARNGVLIKGGVHLEQTGQISTIAFDKTGTLTEGRPVVTDVLSLTELGESEWVGLAAAIEKGSQHPLAAAIVNYAEEQQHVTNDALADFTSMTGKGVKAKIDNRVYFIGNRELFGGNLGADIQEKISTLQQQGKTAMLFGTDTSLIGIIAVADQVRSMSKDVIHELHRLGIKKTVMLTGDNDLTARAIADATGVDETKANLLPEDKLKEIKALEKAHGKVAMIGDGVNDAPALAAATVGIAMGGAGTDTAIETADIALMGDDLTKLPFAIRLSRRALNIIKQNITFSLGIKLLALIMIFPGWLTLWLAIFADMGATLIVTLNALRLLRVKA